MSRRDELMAEKARIDAELARLDALGHHSRYCPTRNDEARLCVCGARRHSDTPGWWDGTVVIR